MKINYRVIGLMFMSVGCLVIYSIPEKELFANHQSNTLCLIKSCFLIDCPGCGLTRGIYCLMHFQFQKAINYNLASPMVVSMLFGELLLVCKPYSKTTIHFNKIIYFLFIGSIIINYIYKIVKEQLFI